MDMKKVFGSKAEMVSVHALSESSVPLNDADRVFLYWSGHSRLKADLSMSLNQFINRLFRSPYIPREQRPTS